jgi:hypothetical protein
VATSREVAVAVIRFRCRVSRSQAINPADLDKSVVDVDHAVVECPLVQ